MDNQETIKILVDKTEVLGRITHRSKSDIGVEIINPYQNISSSLRIGYFARPIDPLQMTMVIKRQEYP